MHPHGGEPYRRTACRLNPRGSAGYNGGVDHYFESNRRRWDEAVAIHLRSKGGVYRVDEFRRGLDVLGPIEREELGDVTGKHILHLQCHFGLDTLCLARRGAHVTGLDFSPKAIEAARALAADCSLEARFVQADVYDAASVIPDRFDLVFASWGAINWIPDIDRWVGVAGQMLRPSGSLYLLEGHPAAMALEEDDAGRLFLQHAYFQGPDPVASDDLHTYTGDEEQLVNTRAYEWLHPLSTILEALRRSGLRLDAFREHDRLPWQNFASMTRDSEFMWRLPNDSPSFPLAFSLFASHAGARIEVG